MRRRFALQILASSAFGSAAITSADDRMLNNQGVTDALLSVLSDIHHGASLYLRDGSAVELQDVMTDVAFFAQEARTRVISGSLKTPAFWQICHDRFLAGAVCLASQSFERAPQTRLLQKLEDCLPLLRTIVERTLA